MSQPLDELYLHWLYGQFGSVKVTDSSRTYWGLARQLYTKEFVWLVPNDDNRIEDGKDLRWEFVQDSGVEVDALWMELGCSMLELLIGLSRRLAFETDRGPRGWFWRLIDNLGLESATDAIYNKQIETEIDEILDEFIWRQYEPSGHGGLFPLEHATVDQREVELWYQLSAYLLEDD